jgi:hypothetical protein
MTRPTVEHLAVVIWVLTSYMAPEDLEAACDHLDQLPVAEHVRPLLDLLREEARCPS